MMIHWKDAIEQIEKLKEQAKMMIHRAIPAACMTIAALFLFFATGIAGGEKAKSANAPLRIPSMFYKEANVLGSRLKARGKEKTIYIGQLYESGGKASNVRVTQQLDGKVKLEGFKQRGAHLSFDGERSYGVDSREKDESLLETFLVDFPEGMLDAVQKGSAMRLIGRGFGPDPRSAPNYAGPRYDIYEVVGPIRCRQDQLIRSKRYYFDSKTGLLLSVRHHDFSKSAAAKIETRFSEWTVSEGSAYPARIERYEDGALVFSFIAEQIVSEPMTDAADFR
jgi:hypothetical protein